VTTRDQFELLIHGRLLAGDDSTASAELFEHYQSRLVGVLRASFWQRDDSLIIDAATDALFQYILNPASYDPHKAPLFNYLVLAAKRDLINAVNKKVRREKSEINISAVENEEVGGNKVTEAVDTEAADETRRLRIIYGRELASKLLREISDPTDRAILSLMIENVRETTEYASVLGITKLPQSEQRKRVKMHKDRIGKQLERFGKRQSGKAN
jgi:DNA-directed RNA polymerase specialized sigma24 family protein